MGHPNVPYLVVPIPVWIVVMIYIPVVNHEWSYPVPVSMPHNPLLDPVSPGATRFVFVLLVPPIVVDTIQFVRIVVVSWPRSHHPSLSSVHHLL